MLIIKNLTVSYNRKVVLQNINLQLESNKIHGFVGLNGAGKSTLLNCIYGFKKPDSGNILLNNSTVKNHDIAFLESTQYFYNHITGNDYIDLFSANNPSFSIKQWNNLFQLPLDELIENYSSGMKKKLALIGIIALDRKIIMLDEPFNTLDLEAVELLKQIIPQFSAQQKTIIITSHILETLTETCDQIHYLRQGNIESSYSRNEFSNLTTLLRELTATTYQKWRSESGNL